MTLGGQKEVMCLISKAISRLGLLTGKIWLSAFQDLRIGSSNSGQSVDVVFPD